MNTVQLQRDLVGPLWALAQDARWFSGRSRDGRPDSVQLGGWLAAPDANPGACSAILTVVYPTGEPERYQVPLAFRPQGESVAPVLLSVTLEGIEYDIGELCEDPEAAGLLLQCLAAGAAGFVAFRDDIPLGLSARRYGGEQSNTTVFFGDQILLKVFRRLEDGPNVDVELHRELAGSGAVAEIYGAWRDGTVDLGVFLETFSSPRDGYVAACEAAAAGTSFADQARDLGATLRRVHAVLAERLGTSSQNPAALVDTFRRRFAAALAEVPALAAYARTVAAVYDQLTGAEVPTQRVHGDCHLGQVLLTDGHWRYVDFEGEPLRTLAERSEYDTPWRDVAGMLRSFDYAAATVIGGAPHWRGQAREHFLAGYGEATGTALLQALEVDKAVYEVVYESRNRPAFGHIPLDFLDSVKGALSWDTTSSAD